MTHLDDRYPACRAAAGHGEKWRSAIASFDGAWEDFPEWAAAEGVSLGLPGYLPDLALIERAARHVEDACGKMPGEVAHIVVNPSLQLLQVSWRHLAPLTVGKGGDDDLPPEEEEELVLLWCDPLSKEVRVEKARESDLLALKVIVEGVDADGAAREAGEAVGIVDVALQSAVRRGVLLSPPSKIVRDKGTWAAADSVDEKFLVSRGFTLQWHITQACDLHCLHCYDRSQRRTIPYEKGLAILDELREFCRRRFVSGHVSFTGGNPLMHPRFLDLYRAASERGFTMSILGNPAPRETIEAITAIEMPYLYQVSLEGLEEHNDEIRGEGHFQSVMEFLPLLKELGVSSMVMLTLTDRNIDEVIPLAERLEGVVDDFTFNRLSQAGEGAQLRLPSTERYEVFLGEYMARAAKSTHMGLKDNLFNIIKHRRGEKFFGGCTGFGCGAAFNFITLLAEGEAHACRKFPSPIGSVLEEGLEGVYESEAAERYRRGCADCRDCPVRPVCGGCLAVAWSGGRDPFTEKDPQCFFNE